jgi:hypothetical protein
MNTSHVTCSRAHHLDVEGLFYGGKRNLFTDRPIGKTSDSRCHALPPGIANSPPHQRRAPRQLQLPRPMEEDNRDMSGSQIWITLRRDRHARDPIIVRHVSYHRYFQVGLVSPPPASSPYVSGSSSLWLRPPTACHWTTAAPKHLLTSPAPSHPNNLKS